MPDKHAFSGEGNKGMLWDISGAFGDIGVFFPIAAALVLKNGFNTAPLLISAGAFYLFSAYYFKITMPVQPLKAMSAIALATGLGAAAVNTAGIIIGFILVAMAVSRTSEKIGKLFPVAVIRGLQLGLGALLIRTAVPMLSVNIELTVSALACVALTALFFKRTPPFLPLLVFSVIIAFFHGKTPAMGNAVSAPEVSNAETFMSAFVLLVLPQIGLTFGNAIVATKVTAQQLYGEKAGRVTLKNLSLSMGISNIISGVMGGIPMCHGSGGLTAHYTFGASSARSGYIIGSVLLLLGALAILNPGLWIAGFPEGVLGVMLCYVAVSHGMLGVKAMSDLRSSLTIGVTALTGLIFGNLTIGLVTGIALHTIGSIIPVLRISAEKNNPG